MAVQNWLREHPRRAAAVAASVVVLLLVVGVLVRRSLGKPAMAPVLAPIERGDVVTNVEATGTVDAVTTVNIGSQVSGRVDQVLVDFNSPVKQGQVLATIEDTRYAAAATQAEADLAAARAAVTMAQSAVEVARADVTAARANLARAEALERKAAADFQRQQEMFQSAISAASELERLKSELEGAQASVAAFRAQVEQAQSNVARAEAQLAQARAQAKEAQGALDAARTNLSYTVIKSPIDGVVVARNIELGQTVAARLSAPNLFNIAQDLEQMYVYTKLDSLDVSKVRVGQKATFTVDAYPGRTLDGTVAQVRISPITQLRGQAAPSQLGAPTQTAIPGLQQQGGTSGGSSSSGGGGSSAGGSGASSAPAPGATAAPGMVHYDALIQFPNPGRRLLPGMTAYVTIPVSSAYDVLRVRKEALGASPDIPETEKKALLQRHGVPAGSQVLWVAEGSEYRPVPVTVGVTDYLFAEITSGNIKDGQQALAGYRQRER